MGENSTLATVSTLIRTWEEEHAQPNYDPIPLLTKLAEIVEEETDNYLKMDPDPFDERHPSRTDPTCNLGQILKVLFKKDNFSNKLISDYMRDSYYARLGISGNANHLNMAACRLVIDIMPGLDTTVVFQPDSVSLIHRLIKWATGSIEPLQTYATGLLGAAMEIPDIATKFRDQNNVLIPTLLTRLRALKNEMETELVEGTLTRPFGHLAKYKGEGTMMSPPQSTLRVQENGIIKSPKEQSKERNTESKKRKSSFEGNSPGGMNISDESSPKRKYPRLEDAPESFHIGNMSPQKPSGAYSETSNSSWAELETFMIGTIQMSPLTNITKQIFILRYLTAMGDYQEFLSHVFEKDALELIFYYVNVRKTKEARLAFEALKYLAALLCHKKFSIEFIQCKGLEALLEVPRPSIAATGVSICLYYLGYCEEAMERVCMFPTHIISSLVKYALWLLECSHDSGRCQAIMFFGLTFQFRVILDEFDEQDGLRKLHNVIATLPILLSDSDSTQLNEEQEGAARQIVRHVCVAYRRYLEAHLFLKVESIRSSQLWLNDNVPMPTYKACKSSPEEIQQQIDMLFQNMPFRSHWAPVDQLLKLGDITLLLKIIAFAYEWNYSGRAETVRSALDVLAIACVMPKVQALFCDRVDLPEESVTVGMNIILGAAEGDIVADTDVQKAALRVIGNCVCAPINRVGFFNTRLYGSTTATNSPNKKLKMKSSEDLIQKVWDCVRSNSGIMVLLQLMQVKTPITDADCIKTLACKALAGLARSEAVRQIVSKLPLFVSGQLQNLMRDPILQEKRQEHVMFQKYVLELLERLSGKGKHTGIDLEASLAKIHRANVVAQTKIRFNDRQLLQLIHQHLVQKGFPDTAATLVKEANLSHVILPLSSQHPQKFKYSSTLIPSRVRLSFSSPNIHRVLPSGSAVEKIENLPNGLNSTSVTTSGIKITKKVQSQPKLLNTSHNSRLQKQTSCEPHPWYQSFQEESLGNDQPRVTLDSITTEYLANQHALCKNPMATCPQFNLFVPHKCPDPKPRITAANNYVIRCARRQIGYQSKPMDRRFVHSRFCPVQTIRTSTDEGFFTCVEFMPTDHTLVAGDYNGDVHLFNLHNGNEIRSFTAHDNYIVNMELNRTGKLLLTSCTWGKPTSAMWDVTHFNMLMGFSDNEYVEFSKVSQDKVIGTKGEVAVIYDVNTCNPISRLVPRVSNQYTKNKATFSYNDELVLSDGVLFDANSGQQIHKLDKLNQTQSGVFHPNGLEIVSNTEVWDIRTFHLLKTVPSLNQCTVTFSPLKTLIYAISMEQDLDDGDATFETSFKTIDAIDYSSIATIDVKKSIYDLAVNKLDTQIALVENMGMFNSIQESVVRVYDVGRRRDDEDEQEEEDEEEEDDLGSDDENSDNDNDGSIDLDNRVDDAEEEENNRDDEDNNSDSNSSWTSTSDSDGDQDNHHILLNFEF